MANAQYDSNQPYASLVAIRAELLHQPGVEDFVTWLTLAIDGHWWEQDTCTVPLKTLLGRIDQWRKTATVQA